MIPSQAIRAVLVIGMTLTIGAPTARAFTIVDAFLEVRGDVERIDRHTTTNCPGAPGPLGGPPCVTTVSERSDFLTEGGRIPAIGEEDFGVDLFTMGPNVLGSGRLRAQAGSSVGSSAIELNSRISLRDGSEGDSVGTGGPNGEGFLREIIVEWDDEFRDTQASAVLDVIFEVDEATDYLLRINNLNTRSSPSLRPPNPNQVAFARLNPLSATGEVLPALFDEELAEEDVRSLRGTLLPGRYALQFSDSNIGPDAISSFNASLIVVPEPSTSTLMMLGLGALAIKRRGA